MSYVIYECIETGVSADGAYFVIISFPCWILTQRLFFFFFLTQTSFTALLFTRILHCLTFLNSLTETLFVSHRFVFCHIIFHQVILEQKLQKGTSRNVTFFAVKIAFLRLTPQIWTRLTRSAASRARGEKMIFTGFGSPSVFSYCIKNNICFDI